MKKRIVAIALLTICSMAGVLGFFELIDFQVSPHTPTENTIHHLPLPAIELPNSTGVRAQVENEPICQIPEIGPETWPMMNVTIP